MELFVHVLRGRMGFSGSKAVSMERSEVSRGWIRVACRKARKDDSRILFALFCLSIRGQKRTQRIAMVA